MTASRPEPASPARPLAHRIAAGLDGTHDPALMGADARLPLHALAAQGFVVGGTDALAGRSLLVCPQSPLAAAAALASLDGVAWRLVLCPPDIGRDQLAQAAALAQADAVITDREDAGLPALPRHIIGLEPQDPLRPTAARPCTEWVLFTSGTSGAPKLVAHSLDGLTDAIVPRRPDEPAPVWATFYDIRRYGGLQMLLRALTGGSSLLVTNPHEALADFLSRAGAQGATHVAGTPSHWRRALMSPALHGLSPDYVRLSGEIADQAVLDALRARFPQARIGHAYASTEAGVGFEVTDGLQGFPAALVEGEEGPVRMQVVDATLQLRSARAARGYLGDAAPALQDAEGWIDTGDLVERRGDRFHFLGRRSGIINVGGLKIAPEEVEAVINACPGVRMSRVTGRSSPLLGALVTAEVVLDEPAGDPADARDAILAHCRARLAAHKTPASIRFVEALELGAAGKLERRRA